MFTPESKVGLFVVASVALLFIMVNMVNPINWFKSENKYTIITYFDSTSGVEEKSNVRIAGVSVGKVSEILLDRNKARVVIELKSEVMITEDAIAKVRSQGLLGEKFIEITSGSPDKPLIKDGGILKNTKTPMDIDEAVDKVGEVLTDLKTVSASFRTVFGNTEAERGLKKIFDDFKSIANSVNKMMLENQIKINNIVSNVEEVTYTLKKNRKLVEKTIENVESISRAVDQKIPAILKNIDKITASLNEVLDSGNKENIRKILANVKGASEKIDGTLSSINSILDEDNRENFKEILSNIKLASSKLTQAVENINHISAKIKNGEGTVGRLVSDETVYKKLDSTLEGINNFVTKADRLKLYVGLRGEYQLDETDTKSFFTIKLQPREDRYYLVEVTNDVRKRKNDVETDSLTDLLYTVQFAKLYKNLGLRIGLIESSFGVGADYSLIKDRFDLTLDAFNFGGYNNSVSNVQLKFTSKLTLFKYLFAYAGVDEILNEKYRSSFGGVGLAFDDDDLKTVLGALR